MPRRPGILYQLDSGKYGVAYRDEQHDAFIKIRKVYVHVFVDQFCTTPAVHPFTKKNIKTLKSIEKIKAIGFVD